MNLLGKFEADEVMFFGKAIKNRLGVDLEAIDSKQAVFVCELNGQFFGRPYRDVLNSAEKAIASSASACTGLAQLYVNPDYPVLSEAMAGAISLAQSLLPTTQRLLFGYALPTNTSSRVFWGQSGSVGVNLLKLHDRSGRALFDNLSDLEQLKEVYLDGAIPADSLESGDFSGVVSYLSDLLRQRPSIQLLSLRQNNLCDYDEYRFKSLMDCLACAKNVVYLDLSDNHLYKLSEKQFTALIDALKIMPSLLSCKLTTSVHERNYRSNHRDQFDALAEVLLARQERYREPDALPEHVAPSSEALRQLHQHWQALQLSVVASQYLNECAEGLKPVAGSSLPELLIFLAERFHDQLGDDASAAQRFRLICMANTLAEHLPESKHYREDAAEVYETLKPYLRTTDLTQFQHDPLLLIHATAAHLLRNNASSLVSQATKLIQANKSKNATQDMLKRIGRAMSMLRYYQNKGISFGEAALLAPYLAPGSHADANVVTHPEGIELFARPSRDWVDMLPMCFDETVLTCELNASFRVSAFLRVPEQRMEAARVANLPVPEFSQVYTNVTYGAGDTLQNRLQKLQQVVDSNESGQRVSELKHDRPLNPNGVTTTILTQASIKKTYRLAVRYAVADDTTAPTLPVPFRGVNLLQLNIGVARALIAGIRNLDHLKEIYLDGAIPAGVLDEPERRFAIDPFVKYMQALSEALACCVHLQVLSLRYNQVDQYSARRFEQFLSLFEGLNALVYLDLSGNHLYKLSQASFAALVQTIQNIAALRSCKLTTPSMLQHYQRPDLAEPLSLLAQSFGRRKPVSNAKEDLKATFLTHLRIFDLCASAREYLEHPTLVLGTMGKASEPCEVLKTLMLRRLQQLGEDKYGANGFKLACALEWISKQTADPIDLSGHAERAYDAMQAHLKITKLSKHLTDPQVLFDVAMACMLVGDFKRAEEARVALSQFGNSASSIFTQVACAMQNEISALEKGQDFGVMLLIQNASGAGKSQKGSSGFWRSRGSGSDDAKSSSGGGRLSFRGFGKKK